MVRQLIGAAVEFAVGKVLIFKQHGDSLGCLFGLCFKPLLNQHLTREVCIGGVEINQHLLALGFR
ncbi:hypothetical protein PB72LOC_03352 [Pectobacterium atrosepticum]|nr:hypothetical protein PB72LOC_03352 [Pectobacterium atrosepticum]